MKRIIYFLLTSLICLSCNSQSKKDPAKDLFEPSYKEQKNKKEFTEYFDKESNTYSNYKYSIAVRFPKNWKHDEGISEHMIFRAFEKDSGYSYSVNVIETKYNIENIFWKEYEKNKLQFQKQLKDVIEKQLNASINVEYFNTTYLKNYKALKRKYNYTVKDDDYEIEMTMLAYQIPKDNFTYTISLIIPKMFYDEKPQYFDDILKDIYWLTNKNELNNSIIERKQ